MALLDFSDKVQYNYEHIMHGNKEAMLGRALNEPFASVNSGSRKLMYAKELEQVSPLINGEKAIVETGYEIRYGDESSSVIKNKENSYMIAKVPKFSFAPNHIYYAIIGSADRKYLDVVCRTPYTYITEQFGYINNNTVLDSIQPGDFINKDKWLAKSMAFDEYNNRTDGMNFNTVYMSLAGNYEDSIILNERIAKKGVSPFVHVIEKPIAENMIPLNLYGDRNTYKVMPDIGEAIPNCIVSAFRPEVKDNCLFNQSGERLRKIMMSDEKIIVRGDNLRVVDVDIYTNNPDGLKTDSHNAQYNMYYNEQMKFAAAIEEIVSKYITRGFELSYDLQKLYSLAKRTLRGDQYWDKKPYSNTIIRITVIEERATGFGDKYADRNGGKGVVSHIWPNEMMPMLPDGTRADAIINSPTMYGRENPAQCFEVSITHVGRELIKHIEENYPDNMSLDEALGEILKYIRIVSPNQAAKVIEYLNDIGDEGKEYYFNSILREGHIDISSKPISESFDIDRLNDLYKAFPYIGQTEIYVPLPDSNGNMRMVPARRKTVFGNRYMLRLKQYGEDKFSATSLSSTNMRNENVKSKAASNYKIAYSNTCNRLGYQEADDLLHAGSDYVAAQLNIHSTSPKTRRDSGNIMISGDPYHVDVRIDPEGSNRNAEIAKVYMKAIGLRINFFKKVKQTAYGALMHCVKFFARPEDVDREQCVRFVHDKNYDFLKSFRDHEENGMEKPDLSKSPVRFRFKLPGKK